MGIIFLILAAFLLSSCSGAGDQVVINSCPTEESEAKIAPTQEALFLYNQKPRACTLYIGGEPLLLSAGYARLVGMVEGVGRVALIEIGGRGVAVRPNEKVESYRVAKINKDRIVLINEKAD